jgi:hypothetical protein
LGPSFSASELLSRFNSSFKSVSIAKRLASKTIKSAYHSTYIYAHTYIYMA